MGEDDGEDERRNREGRGGDPCGEGQPAKTFHAEFDGLDESPEWPKGCNLYSEDSAGGVPGALILVVGSWLSSSVAHVMASHWVQMVKYSLYRGS